MEKTPKRPRDPNQLAKLITEIATGEEDEPMPIAALTPAERGKMGGEKGGRARADSLTPEARASIARKAAGARWDR